MEDDVKLLAHILSLVLEVKSTIRQMVGLEIADYPRLLAAIDALDKLEVLCRNVLERKITDLILEPSKLDVKNG